MALGDQYSIHSESQPVSSGPPDRFGIFEEAKICYLSLFDFGSFSRAYICLTKSGMTGVLMLQWRMAMETGIPHGI